MPSPIDIQPGRLWAAVLGGALGAVLTACVPIAVPGTNAAPSAIVDESVILLDTAGLEPPVNGGNGVFKPAAFLEPLDLDSPRAAHFSLTVATRSPQRVRVRLSADPVGRESELIRTDSPSTDLSIRSIQSGLEDGQGRFWVNENSVSAQPLSRNVEVLIPETLLGPSVSLSVYTDDVGGTAVGAARIELVRNFFNLAVLGDSVMWGNGLRPEQKFSTLVARQIEETLQEKVITQLYAHSGASIVPREGDAVCRFNCYGEVPKISTSVTLQAEQIKSPEQTDLVLVNGCIVDVGLNNIINPFTDPELLDQATARFCGEEMLTLLEKIHALAPAARIVVTGYYPIISDRSDVLGLSDWATIRGQDGSSMDAPLVAELIENSSIFMTVAHRSIAAAVNALNESAGDANLAAFADPGFTEENSVFAPQAWLWSLTSQGDGFEDINLGLSVFPQDPIRFDRLDRCFDPGVLPSLITCVYASVGHPNDFGARAYADAVMDQLRAVGILNP